MKIQPITQEQQEQIEEFLCYKAEQEVSKNTLAQYSCSLRRFFAFIGKREITKKLLLEYKEWLLVNFKPKTANNRIVALNEYLQFTDNHKMCIKGLKIQNKPYVENVINDEEYTMLIKWLLENEKIKMYWIVRFISGTGMRISEVTKLTYKCLKKGVAEIHSKGKERIIMIPQKLIEESKSYFGDGAENKPLFTNRFGQPITPRGIATQLRFYGEKASIRKEVLHPHSLRHFFAIKMMKASNNDISLVSSYLGHSSLNTTKIYTMKSKEEQEQQLNDFMRW